MTLGDIWNDSSISKPALLQKGTIVVMIQGSLGDNHVLAFLMQARDDEGYSMTGWLALPATSDGWSIL